MPDTRLLRTLLLLAGPLAVLLTVPARSLHARQAGTAGATHAMPLSPALLPPNDLRTASGTPGPAYWQQQVDYQIQVTLDPATHRLHGTETITYVNNAPHALDYLWLQLGQNFFAPQSRGGYLQAPEGRLSLASETGGFELARVEIIRDGVRTDAAYLLDDTRLRITLDKPLPPGGAALTLSLDFTLTTPEVGPGSMGRLEVEQGTIYGFSQWFPRLHVYDDVNGWNTLPNLGQGATYLDYGTFNIEITVPRDFIVMATGELENPQDVLTPEQLSRLEQARTNPEPISIIEGNEVGRGETRPGEREMLTWIFRADEVRDFAWAASQAFLWDATSWNDVLIMTAYPREGLGDRRDPGWEEAARYAREALQYYAETWHPYPYPGSIHIAGLGNEGAFPMLAFSPVGERGDRLFQAIDHAQSHTLFPVVVGIDARRYPWMAEGFATFLNHYAMQAFYGTDAPVSPLASGGIATTQQDSLIDQPLMTPLDWLRPESRSFLIYRKPGKGLQLLRDYILGPERFDLAFKAYIRRWAFKHPQPADFFRTLEDAAGEDLGWFWHGWFFSNEVLDQALGEPVVGPETTSITLSQSSGLRFPVDLELSYRDGTTAHLRIPVEAFFTSGTYTLTLPRTDLIGLRLDPRGLLPDIDRSNDAWPR